MKAIAVYLEASGESPMGVAYDDSMMVEIQVVKISRPG